MVDERSKFLSLFFIVTNLSFIFKIMAANTGFGHMEELAENM